MSQPFYQPGQGQQDTAYSFDMAGDQYGSELNFQNFQGQEQNFAAGDPNLYANNAFLNPMASGGAGKVPGAGEFEEEPPLLEATKKEPPPTSITNNIKYNWYQTEKQVVVDALIKNAKPENTHVNISNTRLDIEVILNDVHNRLNVDLKHEINAATSTFRILSTKIELKLNKINNERWSDLENKEDEKKIQTTANVFKTDWDKVVRDIEEEKKEGEAELNELFQKIYGEGSDEVRKAMNKSFLESGGTVLSTNWNEVKTSKVDIKPPEGLEFKKWDS